MRLYRTIFKYVQTNEKKKKIFLRSYEGVLSIKLTVNTAFASKTDSTTKIWTRRDVETSIAERFVVGRREPAVDFFQPQQVFFEQQLITEIKTISCFLRTVRVTSSASRLRLYLLGLDDRRIFCGASGRDDRFVHAVFRHNATVYVFGPRNRGLHISAKKKKKKIDRQSNLNRPLGILL